MAKHTLVITQKCNLRCRNCYIEKASRDMPLATARRAIDFSFAHTEADETVDIGFFGGEPLLSLPRLRAITKAIKEHPGYRRERVVLSVITNGTIWSEATADFLEEQEIHLCVSCDGPPEVQDAARRFRGGKPTSAVVEANLRAAVDRFPDLRVNAVFGPETFRRLPQTVDYFAGLGIRHIYLNPDFSAPWSAAEIDDLPAIYNELGDRHLRYRRAQSPIYLSPIDSKIAVILRGGFQTGETCRMGSAEFAYAPGGWIYPCERLLGAGDGGSHCIGHLDTGLWPSKCACGGERKGNSECLACGIADYCMRWCGCSNYFGTGQYDRVSPFLCASEQAAIRAAFDVLQRAHLEPELAFYEHMSGRPHVDCEIAPLQPALAASNRGHPVRFYKHHIGGYSNG